MAALLALPLITSLTMTESFAQSALLVGDGGTGDEALELILTDLGYTVTVVGGSAATMSSSDGMDVVVISETVSSGSVNLKFKSVAVPVVVNEGYVFDDMGMTGLTSTVDFGQAYEQTGIDMVESAHPIAEGRTGVVEVYKNPGTMIFGVPNDQAAVIAAIIGVEQASIFAYEAGAQMSDGTTAPARRVGFFAMGGAPIEFTDEGMILFANSVLWAAGREAEIGSYTGSDLGGIGGGGVDPGDQVIVGTIPEASVTPVIDGERDAVWDEGLAVEIIEGDERMHTPGEAYGVATLLWTAEALYGYVTIDDDDLGLAASGSVWENDGIEVFVDADNSKDLMQGTGRGAVDNIQTNVQFRATIPMDGGPIPEVSGSAGAADYADAVAITYDFDQNDFAIEFAMPWSAFGVDHVVGDSLGMHFGLIDADAGAKRAYAYAFSGGDYRAPSSWATLTLGAIGSDAAREPAEMPTSAGIESVFPNPCFGSATVVYTAPTATPYSIRVSNVIGQVVYDRSFAPRTGRDETRMALDALATGLYVVSIIVPERGAISSQPIVRIR